MPYPPGHRDATRLRIVRAARRLFNRHGFEAVSVDQIMAETGLTHGGFYRYFASKSDLYAETLECFFTDPGWDSHWDGIEIDPAADDIAPQIVRAYLSTQHFDDIENSCPMIAVPSDVARSGASARRAYERVFEAMVGFLQRDATGAAAISRSDALAVAALCVGGMVIARASADRTLADEVREACLATAMRLGGWQNDARADRRRAGDGARRDAGSMR
jgi:AcrR family transcriptional regulator